MKSTLLSLFTLFSFLSIPSQADDGYTAVECINTPVAGSSEVVLAKGTLNGVDYEVESAPQGQYGFLFTYTSDSTDQIVGTFLDTFSLKLSSRTVAGQALQNVVNSASVGNDGQNCVFGSQSIQVASGNLSATSLFSIHGGTYGDNTVPSQSLVYNITINLAPQFADPSGTVTFNMVAILSSDVKYTANSSNLVATGLLTLNNHYDTFVTEQTSGNDQVIAMTYTTSTTGTASESLQEQYPPSQYQYVYYSYTFRTMGFSSFLWDPSSLSDSSTNTTNAILGAVSSAVSNVINAANSVVNSAARTSSKTTSTTTKASTTTNLASSTSSSIDSTSANTSADSTTTTSQTTSSASSAGATSPSGNQ